MSPGCGHAGWTRVQHRCLTTLMLEEVTHDDQAKILELISTFASKHNVHSKYCPQTTAALSTATQYYAALLHTSCWWKGSDVYKKRRQAHWGCRGSCLLF